MTTMRWGWVLVTLYTGPFGFIVYWLLRRARAEAARAVPTSLWEESIDSTIHCVAGDATGILIAAAVGNWLRLPMGVELIAEYVAGFCVGLFVSALCRNPPMLAATGGRWGTVLPDVDEYRHGRNDPGHDHSHVARHRRDGTDFSALWEPCRSLRGQLGDYSPGKLRLVARA
jgi:hypothetical protein